MRRRSRVVAEHTLETLDRLEVAAALREQQAEDRLGAQRRGDVAAGGRLRPDLLELLLEVGAAAAQAQLELGVGEAELAVVDLTDVTARLEVLDRDLELLRQLAQCLDRGAARTRFDPRDVGVRDPGRREIALRQVPLQTKALQARANRLCRAGLRHAGRDHEADVRHMSNSQSTLPHGNMSLVLRTLGGRREKPCCRGVARSRRSATSRGRTRVLARFTLA